MPQEPDHYTIFTHLGAGIASLLAGLGIGRRNRPNGEDKIVAAIERLAKVQAAEGEKTRKAIYDTASKTDNRMSEMMSDMKVLLDRDRAR